MSAQSAQTRVAGQPVHRESESGPLPRDESRFRYFYPNGKPVLRKNCEGPLTVKTTYERVTEQ